MLFYPSLNVYRVWMNITCSPSNTSRGVQFKGIEYKGFPISMCFLVVV